MKAMLNELKNKWLSKSLGLYNTLGFIRAFVALATNPYNTDLVFKLEQAAMKLAGTHAEERFLASLMRYPGAVEMIKQRYLAPKYKVEDLKDCRPGTLGYAYYHHITDNG